jgi:hypothetical protein
MTLPRSSPPHRRWLLLALFIVLAIASIEPIWSFDYFWHLATGRWIVEHRALPLTDPFTVASARTPWINGEWLFQLLLYPLFRMIGHHGIAIALAVATALFYVASLVRVAREIAAPVALLLITVAWSGGEPWIKERPSAVGALCLAGTIALLMREPSWKRTLSLFAVTVVWMNTHPSALIAPVVVALYEGGTMIGRRDWRPATLRERILPVAVVAMALLVNPYGIAAIVAPMHLVTLIRNGEFRNEEWTTSTLSEDPLLFITAAAAVVLFATREDRWRQLPRFLVFALITALAIRFCRNQSLYYAVYPLLVAGFVPLSIPQRTQRLIGIAAAATIVAALLGAEFRGGVDEQKFPVTTAERLHETGLGGNIYSSDAVGGYLIWSFYGQRRVVADNRNELFVDYTRAHRVAMRDTRSWRDFVRKYDVRLAFFDFKRPPLEVVNASTGTKAHVPAQAVFFPPGEWVLIGVDEAAMLFARRDAYPRELLATLELRAPY